MLLLPAEGARVPCRVIPRDRVLPEVVLNPETVGWAPRVDRTFSEVADQVPGSCDAVRNPGPADDRGGAGGLVGPLVEVFVWKWERSQSYCLVGRWKWWKQGKLESMPLFHPGWQVICSWNVSCRRNIRRSLCRDVRDIWYSWDFYQLSLGSVNWN